MNSVVTNLFFVLPFPLPPLATPNILDHASCCLVAGFRPILLHPLLICASMSAIRVCLVQTGQGTSSSGESRDQSDCFTGEPGMTNLGIALQQKSHAVAPDQTRLRQIVERCRIVISWYWSVWRGQSPRRKRPQTSSSSSWVVSRMRVVVVMDESDVQHLSSITVVRMVWSNVSVVPPSAQFYGYLDMFTVFCHLQAPMWSFKVSRR